jgi:hypothetical protein
VLIVCALLVLVASVALAGIAIFANAYRETVLAAAYGRSNPGRRRGRKHARRRTASRGGARQSSRAGAPHEEATIWRYDPAVAGEVSA